MIALPGLLALATLASAPLVPWKQVSKDVETGFTQADGKKPLAVTSAGEGQVTSDGKVEHVVEEAKVRYAGKPGQELEQMVGADYAHVAGKWVFQNLQFGPVTQLSAPTQGAPPPAPSADEVKKLAKEYVESAWGFEGGGVQEIALAGAPTFSWAQEGQTAEYRFASTTHVLDRSGGRKTRLSCPLTYVVRKGDSGWYVDDALCKDQHCSMSRECKEE